MDLEKSRIEFANLQKSISALNYSISLLFLDAETAAPPKSAANRRSTLEVLNDELFNLMFGEKTRDLMEFLIENKDQLNQVEKRSLEILKRDVDRLKLVPKAEYIKYQAYLSSAQDAWHTANEENDYEIFRPYLERIFENVRGFAQLAMPDQNPYDFCLDHHEAGSNTKLYDPVFDIIKRDVVPLLKEISDKPPIDDSCLVGDYSAPKQKDLAIYIMNLLGLDMSRVGLSTSEHPFTKRLGSHLDERITTRFSRKDFTFSLYTILFGCGYSLAEMGQGDDLLYTMADGSASFGIMEGQTRFYENIIGRSLSFISYIYPKLKGLFPTSIKDSSPKELYLAINKVHAGPIRMGSDEVTNNLHVLVRYELEKALMNKELSFNDLPDAWAEKYAEYLGVEVKDDSHGVLQDMLWSDAAIGYFPTAVLGNAYSALMLEKITEDLNIEECVMQGNFEPINEWNREHIWKHIGLYDAHTVMENFVGIPSIDSDAYTRYLRHKYSDIYNL